jgi:Flp pilus assembly protein TadG
MSREDGSCHGRHGERGVGLLMVAVGMVLFLAAAGLAIDLVAAYVARNEAQRAADAAALAGASVFVDEGCTTTGGCVSGGPQEAEATTQAYAVAGQNPVLGQAPTSASVTTSFSYPNAEEPQITVTVYRDQTHGNPAPTFFATVFGHGSMNISASATAEAYNPSGGGTSVGTSCLRPFLVPNCDPDHPVLSGNSEANTNCPLTNGQALGNGSSIDPVVHCPGGNSTCYASNFFDPNNKGAIVNPGICQWSATTSSCASTSGAVGEPWPLHTEAGPSQWYLLGFTGNSGAALRSFIETCAPTTIACHASLNTANGKKVGPTDQGTNALINASGDGPDNGQDLLCSPATCTNNSSAANFGGSSCSSSTCETLPFVITGGANNPNSSLVNQTFLAPSSSVISVAVYDGSQLASGGSTVTVLGFMQLFVIDAIHSGSDDEIDTVIENIGGCGTTSSSPNPVIDTGGSFVPIRLIHQ